MSDNKKNSYNGFVRSTSNTLTATDHYAVSLPPHVWKTRMGWKLNERVRILTNKAENTITIVRGDE